MSWDEAYKQLEQELGREPTVDEVQRRMLETAEKSCSLGQVPILSTRTTARSFGPRWINWWEMVKSCGRG
jgi:hypothetical protein